MPLALALGGGAALGWTHIGILRGLAEAEIPVGAVAGTSIGALAAVCAAADRLDALEDIARSATLRNVLRYLDPRLGRGAVLGGRTIARELDFHLGHARFETLRIPAAVVATDLSTGEPVIIDRGPVSDAVRASMAIPGLFQPVPLGGRLLIDGGAAVPVPVEAARTIAGGLPVLAINLQGDYPARAAAAGIAPMPIRPLTTLAVVRAAAGLMAARLARYSLDICPPDLELVPPVGHVDVGNFTRAGELIDIGRRTLLDAVPAIRALLPNS